MSYLFMTIDFKQSKEDVSYLKVDDALPATVIVIPTTRANLARFTSDKVSQHNVCPQVTCETWR